MVRYSSESLEWQMQAACRGPQASFFYPPPYFEKRTDKRRREQEAKSICGTCPVLERCLDFALETEEQHGIWGGLNEAERRELMPA